jgi:hypothetical protein
MAALVINQDAPDEKGGGIARERHKYERVCVLPGTGCNIDTDVCLLPSYSSFLP